MRFISVILASIALISFSSVNADAQKMFRCIQDYDGTVDYPDVWNPVPKAQRQKMTMRFMNGRSQVDIRLNGKKYKDKVVLSEEKDGSKIYLASRFSFRIFPGKKGSGTTIIQWFLLEQDKTMSFTCR